ncbi:MAG: low temperature requirement protein A [Vicinamibacterales bacterium]
MSLPSYPLGVRNTELRVVRVLIDRVAIGIAEKQRLTSRIPPRAFGEGEAFRELEQLRRYVAGGNRARKVTWLELFFDLIFVAAVAQVGDPLREDYSLAGLIRFSVLFVLTCSFVVCSGYSASTTSVA